MNFGRYRVHVHNHGFFRLDGGAMFGSVPKALWARVAPPDNENRILLATRSLVVEDGARKLLVDVGCGDKWTEKSRSIFGIEERPFVPVPGVTDVLLTHLHFDHAGGVSRFASGTSLEPCYPTATHYVSEANYSNAKAPNIRERASYLSENIDVLTKTNFVLTQPDQEIWPGLTVHRSDGHTRGLQWVKLTADGMTIAFPSDLVPTSHHLPIPYVMGYDVCAERSMMEKGAFLRQAIEESWIVVFEHDPVVQAGRLAFDANSKPYLAEELDLSGKMPT